jgi:hypothetical protein
LYRRSATLVCGPSAGDGTQPRDRAGASRLKTKRPTSAKFPDLERRKAAAKRAALRALKKARRAAETAGVTLSDWEGEFLGSVEERVTKYGRAFRDPEKGYLGSSLSMLQAVKLKEIAAKAKTKPSKGFRKRP